MSNSTAHSLIYLGLGSNAGHRKHHLKRAIEVLELSKIYVVHQSQVIESEAWGELKQPAFLNMVLACQSQLAPFELLNKLEEIEREIGRVDKGDGTARAIDIDILFYDDITINSARLQIPHRHLHERNFVLVPLAEIASDFIHPKYQVSVMQLLSQSTDTKKTSDLL